MHLRKYEDALSFIENYLIEEPANLELIELQKKAITEKSLKDRDERKQAANEKKKQNEFQKTVDALIERDVKIEEVRGEFDFFHFSHLLFHVRNVFSYFQMEI